MFCNVERIGMVKIVVSELKYNIEVWWLILFDSVLMSGWISMNINNVVVIMLFVMLVCIFVVFIRYFCI